MKKLIMLLIACIPAIHSLCQEKTTPLIKQGTKLNYSLSINGQIIPMSISIDSATASYLKLGWTIEGMGTGSWVVNKKSLETATLGYWSQPSPGTEEVLPDNQSVLVLSQAQWAAIQNNGPVNYDDESYTVKQPADAQQLKPGGKIIDAVLLESTAKNTRLWILKNAQYPLILKVEGNTKGPDLDLISIQ